MAEYIDREEIEKKARYRKELGFPCVDVIDIHETPTVNAIPIPEGATNGDMIKAMFSSVEIEGIEGLEGLQCVAVSIGLGTSYFALDWWNAPYKKEVEENDRHYRY